MKNNNININFNEVTTSNDKTEKIILFTKIPKIGFGKSRLLGVLNKEQVYDISEKLIKDTLKKVKNTKINYSIHYSGDDAETFFENEKSLKNQEGDSLASRMLNSIKYELENGYKKVILIGSDLVNIDEKILKDSFNELDNFDVVICKTKDGGFGLIGMKEAFDIFTGIEYSNENVFINTIKKIDKLGLSYKNIEILRDIDEFSDIINEEVDSIAFSILGYGEYNLNYKLQNGKVFRVNTKSQMNLKEKQIEYEYNALKELESTGVVPKVYSYNLNGKYLPFGNLYMEFLNGRELDYDKDLDIAAFLLSTIHNHKIINENNFVKVTKPFNAMYDEFLSMYSFYQKWNQKEKYVCDYIDNFLKIAKELDIDSIIENPCIINTELNNRNFIIGEKSYVIDWEKPIIGECEQDLAHFLVPTTTNWKTDKILNEDEIEYFLNSYEKYRKVDRRKLNKYMIFNTLRGVTWCSMAKVEYSTNRSLTNEETLLKINKFLSKEFLEYLYKNFYEVEDVKKTQK